MHVPALRRSPATESGTDVCGSKGDPAKGVLGKGGAAWFWSTSSDLSSQQWSTPQEIEGSWEQYEPACCPSLGRKLKGHYEYYGITGNSPTLQRFRYQVERLWWYWLGTRSWRARQTWDEFQGLLKRHPLPPAIAVHSVLRHAANL